PCRLVPITDHLARPRRPAALAVAQHEVGGPAAEDGIAGSPAVVHGPVHAAAVAVAGTVSAFVHAQRPGFGLDAAGVDVQRCSAGNVSQAFPMNEIPAGGSVTSASTLASGNSRSRSRQSPTSTSTRPSCQSVTPPPPSDTPRPAAPRPPTGAGRPAGRRSDG